MTDTLLEEWLRYISEGRTSLADSDLKDSALRQSTAYVAVGSNYDLRHRLALRLECDGESTFGPERRLCGGDRT
jgi:hypothetical protein